MVSSLTPGNGLLLETSHLEIPSHENHQARPMPTYLNLFIQTKQYKK
jgi:hypothetical protein